MSAPAPPELARVLPGEPASVGQARRLAAEALRAWGRDELVDEASLLISEVVTNAVLHAGTDIEVRIRPRGAGVHIEVADGSPVLPALRHYHGDAITGRGLRILETTASQWGTLATDSGKVVWFDLGATGPAPVAPVPQSPPPAAAVTIRLLGLLPMLTQATLEHGDALLRELALMSFDEHAEHSSMAPIVTPGLDLCDLLVTIERSIEDGLAVADLDVRFPAGSSEAAFARLALVDEADRMASDGELLIPAALPEIASCRQWLLGEIVNQTAGGNPTRWDLVAAPVPERGWETVDGRELALLGDERAHSIVSDEANRIVFVGEAAAALLQWPAGALVGRRLTDIIPPELREAHLVGFTRYQLTGRPRLFGDPLPLRARRADGTDVEVTVTLNALPRRHGRFRHRATVVPR